MSGNSVAALSDSEWSLGAVSSTIDDDATLSGFDRPAWYSSVMQSLIDLRKLEENWDSYGAQPVHSWSIIAAYELLSTIMKIDTPAPWIVPTPSGRLQMEWHEQDIDLEVEILSFSNMHVFFEDHRGESTWEGEVSYDLSRLGGFITELTSRARNQE